MEFRILGPLEVVADDGSPVAVAGAKPRALLAALLLRANEVVSAERLIDELWEEHPPETAANALQVYVSQLRKALGADVVLRRPPGYVVEVERARLDLARFEDLVETARDAPPEEAGATLREALGLWRGEPEVDRGRLEELRFAALEARVDADLELGRHAELVPELQALVETEPLRERPRAQLMLALYRSGRQADALAEFAKARETLVDELGVEPGPELQRLQRAILEQDASLAAGEPVEEPNLLPVPATEIVGRENEVAQLVALLDDGARLVTLTGPGGIGKTRLAVEAARRIDPRTVFVGLATVDDPALVAPAVARALRLEVSGVTAEEAIEAHLRTRDTLLLLDNFEQLLDAAPLVSSLLAAAPRLRVLVTSQSVLRVSGEREVEVPPLDAAVDLFLQRASGSVEDVEAVRAICERLDGLPLAIELAAARTKLLPPAVLLERLESRLELLTAGSRDAPERQRTMRAAIDWSYRLLDPDEQVLFARLAVFVGGATLDAVEDVCGAGLDVLDALASLADKSLIRRRGEREPRFWMLETLREYAGEQLRALGEEDTLRARHLAYFVRLTAQAEPLLDQREQSRWLQRLEDELPNVRAALAFALERGDAPSAVEIAGALRRFWQVHGHLEEGQRWLEAALAAGDELPPVEAAKAWTGLGIMRGDRGDYEGSKAAFEQALAHGRAAENPHRVASALNNLATVALFGGDNDAAQQMYEEALALNREHGSATNIGAGLENIGCVHLLRGDVDTAIERLEEATAFTDELGDPRSMSSTRRWLARALVESGALERARELLAESLDLAEQINHRQGIACTLDFAAAYAVAAGRPDAAAQLAAGADAVWTSVGAARPPDVSALVVETPPAAPADPATAVALARDLLAGRP